ncbi:MAG: hypothetical protein WC359_12410 [Dehalococcoidia bacterium]
MDKKVVAELKKKPGVVSVGRGFKVVDGVRTDEVAIVVGVKKKLPAAQLAARDIIPQAIDGQATDVIEVGDIKALVDPPSHTGRYRPAPAGVSIGHHLITAGTLGCYVKRSGVLYVLSNCHVLANSGDAVTGDVILQPGPHDSGTVEMDSFAKLSGYIPINFVGMPSKCPVSRAIATALNAILALFGRATRFAVEVNLTNSVDCAIARPDRTEDIDESILEAGPITEEVVEPQLGMKVLKSGRTTGFTHGEITQVDVTINVSYGEKGMAIFENQFIAEGDNICAGGDSGSLVFTTDGKRVGLLFAGDQASKLLIANRYQSVKVALGLD